MWNKEVAAPGEPLIRTAKESFPRKRNDREINAGDVREDSPNDTPASKLRMNIRVFPQNSLDSEEHAERGDENGHVVAEKRGIINEMENEMSRDRNEDYCCDSGSDDGVGTPPMLFSIAIKHHNRAGFVGGFCF